MQPSDVDLLSDLDGIVYFDAEVPHGALDLGMPQQKLDGPEVACPPVDQHCLGSSKRMRAKFRRIKAYAGNPLVHEPGILSRRQSEGIAATGKEELPGSSPCRSQIVIDCRASLVGQLEPSSTRSDHVTAAQLAVDGQVEQG